MKISMTHFYFKHKNSNFRKKKKKLHEPEKKNKKIPTPVSETSCLARTSSFLSCDPVSTPSIFFFQIFSVVVVVVVSSSCCWCSRYHVEILCIFLAVGFIIIWGLRSDDRGTMWTMWNLSNQRFMSKIVDEFKPLDLCLNRRDENLEYGGPCVVCARMGQFWMVLQLHQRYKCYYQLLKYL